MVADLLIPLPSSTELDNAANQAGVSGQAENVMNEVADAKVNSDIPFGNK